MIRRVIHTFRAGLGQVWELWYSQLHHGGARTVKRRWKHRKSFLGGAMFRLRACTRRNPCPQTVQRRALHIHRRRRALVISRASRSRCRGNLELLGAPAANAKEWFSAPEASRYLRFLDVVFAFITVRLLATYLRVIKRHVCAIGSKLQHNQAQLSAARQIDQARDRQHAECMDICMVSTPLQW